MITALLIGLFVGALVGILPGLGLTAGLILLYPLLKLFDPVELLVFYIALVCSVQYFGSVVGIYLGIPGEINSLISSKNGFFFTHKNQGSYALGATAIASLFSAAVGIFLFYYVVHQSQILLPLLSVKVQWTILMIILLALILNKNNSIIYNLLFVSIGLLLSCIGYNAAGVSITFNSQLLNPGMNTSIVLMMLYVIPNLLKYYSTTDILNAKKFNLDIVKSVSWTIKGWAAIIRGTVIGCLSGLIPGIGPVICSNLAGSFENKLNRHKKANELLAAESANNAAILVALIPFVGLGLAILPHEAVVYDLLINNGIAINIEWLKQNEIFETIMIYAIVANIIAFIIAWPASRLLISLYALINYKTLVHAIVLVVGVSTLYQSYIGYRIDVDVLSILAFLPLTFFITKKRLDTLPIVFSFLIGDQVTKSSIFLYNIL